MTLPQPRPALRRAPDAEVHPASVIPLEARLKAIAELRPSTADEQAHSADSEGLPDGQGSPDGKEAATAQKVKKSKKKAKKAKAKGKKAKGKQAKKGNQSDKETPPMQSVATSRFARAGGATSDAVLLEPDRRAPLNVMIPQPLRDRLRDVAKMSGTRQDDLVTELLATGLSDARRW